MQFVPSLRSKPNVMDKPSKNTHLHPKFTNTSQTETRLMRLKNPRGAEMTSFTLRQCTIVQLAAKSNLRMSRIISVLAHSLLMRFAWRIRTYLVFQVLGQYSQPFSTVLSRLLIGLRSDHTVLAIILTRH